MVTWLAPPRVPAGPYTPCVRTLAPLKPPQETTGLLLEPESMYINELMAGLEPLRDKLHSACH